MGISDISPRSQKMLSSAGLFVEVEVAPNTRDTKALVKLFMFREKPAVVGAPLSAAACICRPWTMARRTRPLSRATLLMLMRPSIRVSSEVSTWPLPLRSGGFTQKTSVKRQAVQFREALV